MGNVLEDGGGPEWLDFGYLTATDARGILGYRPPGMLTSKDHQRAYQWAIAFFALVSECPNTTRSLLAAFKASGQWLALQDEIRDWGGPLVWSPPDEMGPLSAEDAGITLDVLREIEEPIIARWAACWNLPGDESHITFAAGWTGMVAFRTGNLDAYRGPLLGVLATLGDVLANAGKTTYELERMLVNHLGRRMRRIVHEYELQDAPVFLDDLEDSENEEWRAISDGREQIGVFKTRTESIAVARERIMRELKPRVTAALERIAAYDQEHLSGTVPAVVRSLDRYRWLWRYQSLGMSKHAIAEGVAAERGHDPNSWYSHVARDINNTAEELGLTLRESKGVVTEKPSRDRHVAPERTY